MTHPIQIRRLHPEDAETYRQIRLATLATEPDFFGSVHAIEAARPLAHFTERLASAFVFGAFGDGQIVGVVDFVRESGPREAHKGVVRGFYVEPGWRGQGVGSALMAALIAAARAEVEQLTLTVVQGNAAAIALYERFGFVTYGIEPRARKTEAGYRDKVLMALLLRPA